MVLERTAEAHPDPRLLRRDPQSSTAAGLLRRPGQPRGLEVRLAALGARCRSNVSGPGIRGDLGQRECADPMSGVLHESSIRIWSRLPESAALYTPRWQAALEGEVFHDP